MISDIINRFMHSRGCVFLMATVMFIAAVIAYNSGTAATVDTDTGPVLTSPDRWIPSGLMSMTVNTVLNILLAFLLVTLNKTYNTMRSLSSMAASVFLIMQTGSPGLLIDFNKGTMMAIVLIATAFLLFSVYQNPGNPRRIFLIFFLISLGTLSLYSIAFYIPVVALGMAQMRTMTFRCVCAAILGIITPLWILGGFGIITPDDFVIPQIVSIFKLYETPVLLTVIATSALTILLGITFIMLNFIKMLTYNARIRAANGFLTALLIASMIFAIIDFYNIAAYTTIINWLVAYQAGHYFATSGKRRSYIAVILIMAAYLTIYAWNLSL